MKFMMKKKQKKAFSLIELSVVILIISILVNGGLGISKTAINNHKTKVTNQRMDEVYSALGNFVLTNRSLPHPSPLALAVGTSEYGVSDAVNAPNLCNAFTPVSGDVIYGMVPAATLGLSPEYGEDGFGTKFSYVVERRFTKVSDTMLDNTSYQILS
ncbi:MAG: prepilin-type N-terminal cleavage/methylation domain-containing protein [Lentimonas sp.]|jgi:prepilin-type N-terminal cleavage/methylation domain-containing protein